MAIFKVKEWAYKSGGNFIVSRTQVDRDTGVFMMEAEIIRETEKAILVSGLGEGHDTWFAKSTIVEGI